MANLINLNINEKIKYSDLDDSFKDQLLDLFENQIENKELIKSELDESRVDLGDVLDQLTKILKSNKKSKADLQDIIEDAIDELENVASNIQNATEYHHEKIKDIKELL